MVTTQLELSDHKQRVAKVYNLASEGYDRPALKFFPRTATRLVQLSHIRAGDRILDVGTGTGAAALAAVPFVGRNGQVIGQDIGIDILAQAQRKINNYNAQVLSFFEGDMEAIEFPDQSFDVVLSASTLFFLPDMAAGLREWQRVLKPGGWVAVSGYGEAAFQPLADLFARRIRTYGVELAETRPFSWQRLTEPEQYLSLFQSVGLRKIEVYSQQLGYYLQDVDQWWEVVWNSGFRGPVSQLEPAALAQFKAEHLAEVEGFETVEGLWMDITAIFAIGQKTT